MTIRQTPQTTGFSLLELVAVMAIVAILLSVALPSYQAFMLRVHRTEAVVALLDVASCQERVYATRGRYDTTQCIPSGLKHYSVSMDPPADSDSLAFTAWAEPQGIQNKDECGSLGLDQTGLRQVSGGTADSDACWRTR